MSDADRHFNQWFSSHFGQVNDSTIEEAFKKVARAAWNEGVSFVHSHGFSQATLPGPGQSGSNSFSGYRGSGVSSSQFDDTNYGDRPDAPRSHDSSRSYSQFSDGAILPR